MSSRNTAELQKLFADLSSIEFESATDVQAYVRKVRDAMKTLAVEIEFAADDLEARLKAVQPGPDETGVVIARKANRVARQWRRAAEAAREVGIASSKGWSSMRTHFGEHMDSTPKKNPKKIDLKS